MCIFSVFKKFAMRGNVISLEVGVVAGTAFGSIVTSLVADVIMPPLGVLLAGVNFSELAVEVGTGPEGEPVLLKYGVFIQAMINFLSIAFVILMAVRAINKLQRPAPPPA